jgi:hypothetical protein
LRDDFGVERPSFAFPYGCPRLGHAGEDLVDEVRKLELPTALTTVAQCVQLADSPHHWGRFNAYDWDTSQTLAAKLSGYYSWAPQLVEQAAEVWRRRPRVFHPVAEGVQADNQGDTNG